eukprot:3613360-Rhodomonas_salina.2
MMSAPGIGEAMRVCGMTIASGIIMIDSVATRRRLADARYWDNLKGCAAVAHRCAEVLTEAVRLPASRSKACSSCSRRCGSVFPHGAAGGFDAAKTQRWQPLGL